LKPKPIKDLVSEFLKGNNLKKINEIINISTAWTKIVGTTISKNTEIKNIKNGKITIKTSSPIWRNELIFQKEHMLKKIKKECPKLNINEIEFR